MGHDEEAPPKWSWLEPLSFNSQGICQEPGWLRGKTRAEIDVLSAAEWKALRPRAANSRLAVIEGTSACARPSTGNLEAHQCAACSDEVRFPYDRLVKIRVRTMVCRGTIEGGSEWWVCARCGKAYYRAGRRPGVLVMGGDKRSGTRFIPPFAHMFPGLATRGRPPGVPQVPTLVNLER